MPPVLGNLIALAGVGALVFLSVRTLWKSRKSGGGCASCGSAGSCAHCGGCASGGESAGGNGAVKISKRDLRRAERNYRSYLKKKEQEVK